ncbi:MAG: SpaA isopeptide-forming pilin-related protein [Gemmiger sp.]
MDYHDVQQLNHYMYASARRRRWYRLMTVLACVVVFCTVYALILPAITMEKGDCELPEHTHTAECYTKVSAEAVRTPVCTAQTLGLHRHTEACYGADGSLRCGYADFVVHRHDANCYDSDGNLWCTLPEVETHTHDAGCYAAAAAAPAHVHTDACYTGERGELLCMLEESESHHHDEGCYDPEGGLTCGLEETDGHSHTDDCYAWNTVLVCDVSTEQPAPEQELVCSRQEIVLHEHTQDCYDGSGNLICGRLEVREHQHTGACFETEVQDDTLTCTLPEDENHTHGPMCYGTWELTCGMEEHTHTGECQPAPALTQEEQARADEVAGMIALLPTAGEYGNTLAAYDETGDSEGKRIYTDTVSRQAVDAYDAYMALTDAEKQAVSNYDKLEAFAWAWQEPESCPELTADEAMVCELTETGVRAAAPDGSASDTTAVYGAAHNGETLYYGFSFKTQSFDGTEYSRGRVRLEAVLPFAEDCAAFDLTAMEWLNAGEEYALTVRTEERVIDGEKRTCQVLNGYIDLQAADPAGSVIPGTFEGAVAVALRDAVDSGGIYIQLSAAMEHNTWDGECAVHEVQEKRTITTKAVAVTEQLSDEERQKLYEQFLREIEELEALDSFDSEAAAKAERLLAQLQEAYAEGSLTEEQYNELYGRAYALLYGDANVVAEAAEGVNWMLLRDSGWFEQYSGAGNPADSAVYSLRSAAAARTSDGGDETQTTQPSDVQVSNRGGTNRSEDGSVSVSKTISGTELENVFDITLEVQTSVKIQEIREEPDMAVVIVMDISNTMNSNFGGVTRYAAAMKAAEKFLDQFAENNSLGISKVGYVAFNTNAHQIFGLQACSTQAQANALKNTMRTQTGNIINASGYSEAHSRFTNVEAGLAMAADMLNGVSNQNKYIIFLSDGFPTTYISSGYSGYDPYDSTGRFYDHVLNKPCLYGTSYSDEAAIRARNKAETIKKSGVTIFSIGVDVAGQTIQQYITQSENASGFSVVDRTGTTYEIGDASSTEAYKNWLRNSIGSGYYYDSTDLNGLLDAYQTIFAEIKHETEEGSRADWVTSDPMPTTNGVADTVEFIGFYNKTPELVSDNLQGSYGENGENTASYHSDSASISWDLKQSGFTTVSSGGTTTYIYRLVYRVRLKNEANGFTEDTIYSTNDTTTLQYRTIEGTDGAFTISDPKTVNFPIPSVRGYLADLTFHKVDPYQRPVEGAEFTLTHDTQTCAECRGDGTSVTVGPFTAASGTDGTVTFTNIPSGHTYSLKETKVPAGYSSDGITYTVRVAYDQITVTPSTGSWDGTIVNSTSYELPDTGGRGTVLYTAGGTVLITGAGLLLLSRHRKRKKEGSRS